MSATPMMQQYHEAKAACPDALLLFRMGDFYELFFDDAKTAAAVLGLTLTSRDKGENPVPMAGFPYHQLESYLGKLIRSGHRAAVCEQVEDPKQAKGIVRREVTRVVTPGTLTDDALLDPRVNNYLAAIVPHESVVGLAWVELSTGTFQAMTVPMNRLPDELSRIDPAECLLVEQETGATNSEQTAFNLHFTAWTGGHARAKTKRPSWYFGWNTARTALLKQLGTTGLDGFGFDEQADRPALRAAGALVQYLHETQKTELSHVDRITPYRTGETLEIDEFTRRSLELNRSLRNGGREGTLLSVLDQSVTAMGSRLCAAWLAAPLTDPALIIARQDAVAELLRDRRMLAELREELREIYDMERLVSRVSTGRCSPRDLRQVAVTLAGLPRIKAKLAGRSAPLLTRLEAELDLCPELAETLRAALRDDCPLTVREGGIIRDGYHAELDQLHELAGGGKQWIAQFQADEIRRTGINRLKVGFNKVFGYYIEITNTHAEKIPPEYIRKQTVKNAERYITPELKESEERILHADDRAKELEYDLFQQLRELTARHTRRLRGGAAALAELDVLAGFAESARTRDYCRPSIIAEPELEIRAGRHPVVDALVPAGTFVPNDTICGATTGHVLLITGPNMAGKSTYIRQTALITLLAQIGSYVPAKSAVVGVTDRIFARVGASDELARGQSTFMVEMTETARILNTATARSLVILDEIGRGTSTYDGVSLAWAITEHLHDRIGCRTLFATHYHELTQLAEELGGLRNCNVAVREWDEQVVFLHQIVPGAADKSYGIHVARLAGVPRDVHQRAKEILANLEQQAVTAPHTEQRTIRPQRKRAGEMQLLLFEPDEHPLIEQLRRLDMDQVAPAQAWQLLREWRESLARK